MNGVLSLAGVSHRYAGRRGGGPVWALRDVDLELMAGETVGIVGESGSGKTTLGMVATGQARPATGSVRVLGEAWSAARHAGHVQMVFQDPLSSLDPRMRVEDILLEPFLARGEGTRAAGRDRAVALLERVGLGAEHLSRRRAQFSGGQCQRIAIARAMITRPSVVVLDEPTSSLDVIVQARVLNLLRDFQEDFGTAYLFITHNLAVVEAMADRVAVLYRGRVVEQGVTREVLDRPVHPYTRALAAAVFDVDAWRHRDEAGELEDAGWEVAAGGHPRRGDAAPDGCAYADRCPLRTNGCDTDVPALVGMADGRAVACHVLAPSTGDRAWERSS